MSFSRWMNKKTVVYRDNGILFSDKKNEISSFEKTWRKQTHITKWIKPVCKGYILYDSKNMTFWKRQNNKRISGCLGKVGEGWIDTEHTVFFRAVKLLCMILYWWIYATVYLYKLTECTTPRMTSKVNYRFWVMTYQCIFTNC